MTFDLLPHLYYYVIPILAVAAIGIVLAVGALTDAVVTNHRARVRRHESIPVYYRRLTLSH